MARTGELLGMAGIGSFWEVLRLRSGVRTMIFFVTVLLCGLKLADSEDLPNCSFPAVYTFGDSLTDNGNAIAAFPEQFIVYESRLYGFSHPGYPDDRYCDGWLLADYIAFGVGRKPASAYFRSIAGNFTHGANFAVAGATARNNTVWYQDSGFNTPFSLNNQVSWLSRYKVRLQFYYEQFEVNQTLPSAESLNTSLYVVNAGFQDYFFGLYNQTLTPSEALDIVPSVVDAVIAAVKRIHKFGARSILIVNLPPLGCTPALLTSYYQDSAENYDGYGCLKDVNKISKEHNRLLETRINALRKKRTRATFYLADYHRVYREVLKSPSDYGISNPLSACCGHGGAYNFDPQITCGHTRQYNGHTINLAIPCLNPAASANWDGIHPSSRVNLAAASAFFSGKFITPKGRLPVRA